MCTITVSCFVSAPASPECVPNMCPPLARPPPFSLGVLLASPKASPKVIGLKCVSTPDALPCPSDPPHPVAPYRVCTPSVYLVPPVFLV